MVNGPEQMGEVISVNQTQLHVLSSQSCEIQGHLPASVRIHRPRTPFKQSLTGPLAVAIRQDNHPALFALVA